VARQLMLAQNSAVKKRAGKKFPPCAPSIFTRLLEISITYKPLETIYYDQER